jgi:hypothetical protein
MNKKAMAWSGVMAALCAVAMLTLVTWPLTDSITWKPLTPLGWWQFEWLHALGFWLCALPSFVIYAFDGFFASNESLRNPVSVFLVVAEILLVCVGIYKCVAAVTAQQSVQPDRRENAAPG